MCAIIDYWYCCMTPPAPLLVCLACLEQQWGYSKEGSRTNTPRASSRGCPTCSIALGPHPYSFVM